MKITITPAKTDRKGKAWGWVVDFSGPSSASLYAGDSVAKMLDEEHVVTVSIDKATFLALEKRK
jgi:hypothetical protein